MIGVDDVAVDVNRKTLGKGWLRLINGLVV